MIRRLAVCSGIFLLMALSNAVVPVLDVFAIGPEEQGLVFSAYFFGATLMVLPAGMAADRFSRRRLMQVGLGVSLLAGLVIAVAPNVWSIVGARFVEGVATGLFVSAGLAHVNSQADNGRSSGAFMASLNAGLLAGLILTGLLVELTDCVKRCPIRLPPLFSPFSSRSRSNRRRSLIPRTARMARPMSRTTGCSTPPW